MTFAVDWTSKISLSLCVLYNVPNVYISILAGVFGMTGVSGSWENTIRTINKSSIVDVALTLK